MPKFNYIAIDAGRHRGQGRRRGLTSTAAGARPAAERGLELTSVVEEEVDPAVRDHRKKVPRKDLMHFSRQLAVFLRAGIPVLDALEIIREEVPKKSVLERRAWTTWSEALRAGATFSGAGPVPPRGLPALLPRHRSRRPS